MTANVNQNVKHISSTTIDTAVICYSFRPCTRRKQYYFRSEWVQCLKVNWTLL